MRTLTPICVLMIAAIAAAEKAPFKILFGHDTTCITSCDSPWRPNGGRLTDDQVRASIDEIKGADAILFQPGCGWIPWWKSKVYPAERHYRFYEETYGLKPNTFGEYMLGGGDLLKTFTARCRERDVASFVSLRMNDGHGLENAGLTNAHAAHTVSIFYLENYKRWRIGPDPKDWNQHVLDWAVPEVREHKFSMIEEICRGYDIDGLEMDFMRHPSYFKPDFPAAQRREIMTEFTGRVRKLLDATASPGKRRWLCIRLPAYLDGHGTLGLDVAALAAAGADMFNLSSHYCTMQQSDVARIRALVPQSALYLEMTHTTATGRSLASRYDSFTFRRTTAPQYATTAQLSYADGADGMSLFNFVYYRKHGAEGRGPFNEPPFDIIPRLSDRAWLAGQPQWYFLAREWRDGAPIPKTFSRMIEKGGSFQCSIRAVSFAGSTKEGTLRLMASKAAPDRQWRVLFNGVALTAVAFVPKPLDNPYDASVGEPDQYACFALPRKLVCHGENVIDVHLDRGPVTKVEYLDFVLP